MAQPNKTSSESVWQQRNFSGGIANFDKEDNNPYAYVYSQCLDTRSHPYILQLGPATQKESGSVVTDLLKFGDLVPSNLTSYLYGDSGNLYSRNSSGSWSLLRSVAGSHGNGLGYFYGDDYLYYTTDTAIGRYGMISGATQTFNDNFLASVGGIPQNTNSIQFLSASSQYATAADSASLSITSDLTLEAFIKPTTLPAVGSTMSLIAKWDQSTNSRSYRLDILGISGFFGDGSDGSLTVSSPTTQAPTDSACTGTSASQTLSATNASFTAGKPIFIVQSQGTGAGKYERNIIQSYTAGTITTVTPLKNDYTTGAQVIQIPQYTNVTITSTWTEKAWNGTTGGYLIFLYNGTLSGSGTISANGCGFRGGTSASNNNGTQGEGISGLGSHSVLANGNGGGAGVDFENNAGGGGSNGSTGGTGSARPGKALSNSGVFGAIAGSNDLSTIVSGGGGGAGAYGGGHGGAGIAGSNGGGCIMAFGVTFAFTGTITANGVAGQTSFEGASGGGAGGSISIKSQTVATGATIQASGGASATSAVATPTITSGAGGDGRIAIAYLTSNAATSTPTANAFQDNNLVTTTSYQARLGISSTGTNSEFLSQNLPTLTTGMWNRISVSWKASTSTATFYLNALPIGTAIGTLTAISNNASLLYIAADKGASAVGNFFNGLVDDVRIWNNVQTASQIFTNNLVQVSASNPNLAAYYSLNAVATDATANANNLTLVNAPIYVTDIPFQDTSVRLDIDQSYTTVGDTYALGTTISESLANQLPFTPQDDPQKGIDLNVAAVGTGNWTVTIHDQQNNVVATSTILNASMAVGYQYFSFSTPWRIVINKNYHAHITSTVADGTIVSSAHNSLQSGGTAAGNFHTYYQFLVTDTFTHPIARMLNFIAVGNERYIAKWDGAFYSPNFIAFPAGTHVRCMGYWGTYLAIGTWQESTTGTPNVYDFPTGKIYFWDGISLTFNFSIDIPEGPVNAIYGMDDDLYYIAGWKADLMYYHGSFANQSGSFNGTKAKRVPYLGRGEYIETYPQAMAMWQGLLYFGMGGNSDSTRFPRDIYAWGTLHPQYPQTLTSEYVISTGNDGSSVRLGLVFPVGKKLLIGWGDNGAYGCDVIDPSAGVLFKSGYLRGLVQDGGQVWRDDLIVKTRADHIQLSAGATVQVGSYPDRATHFDVEHSATDSTGRFTVNPLENGRVNEFQVQVNLLGNGTVSPGVIGLAAMTNPVDSENQF